MTDSPSVPKEVSARLDEADMIELRRLAVEDDRPPSSMARVLIREALAARQAAARKKQPKPTVYRTRDSDVEPGLRQLNLPPIVD